MADANWCGRLNLVDCYADPRFGVVAKWHIRTVRFNADGEEVFVSKPDIFHCKYRVPPMDVPAFVENLRREWFGDDTKL
jgi:hypothetical protein